MSNSRLGQFALEERLRGDGKGDVYRAIHLKHRKQVALKVFPAPLADRSQASQQALAKEVETLKKLQHPHVVQCFGGGFSNMQGYLAYELISGETLRSILNRRGRLGWEQAMDYGRQICTGLEHAHTQQLVHQDLTPSKVLVDDTLGDVKIAGYRVERSRNTFCDSSPSPPAMWYWSPEQLNGGPITIKSDLYSLGCMLFEMLTGDVPHRGDTVEQLQQARQASPAPRPSSVVLECPAWLDGIIQQLLAPDPQNRPYAPGAVLLAFQHAGKNMAAGVSMTEHAAGGFSPLSRPDDNAEARKLLQPETGKVKPPLIVFDGPPLYERPWFLVLCLLLIAAVVGFFAWPASEKTLFDRAERLMQSEDLTDWKTARSSYLEPLLSRFPDGEYAERSQQYVDQIDQKMFHRRAKFNLRMGADPETDGEALYILALSKEEDDPAESLKLLDQLAATIAADGPDRPYVLLAQTRLAEARQKTTEADGPQAEIVQGDQLLADGQYDAAQRMFEQIVEKYSGELEHSAVVEQAESRLAAIPEIAAAAAGSSSQPTEEPDTTTDANTGTTDNSLPQDKPVVDVSNSNPPLTSKPEEAGD